MTGNRDTCAEEAKWFRKSRDWAKEYRDRAIARANAIADNGGASFSQANEITSGGYGDPYLTSFTASSQNELSFRFPRSHS